MDKVLMRNIVIGLAVLLIVIAIVMFMMNRTSSKDEIQYADNLGGAALSSDSDLSPKALEILKDFFHAGVEPGEDMLLELAKVDTNMSIAFIDKLRKLKLAQYSKNSQQAMAADMEMADLFISFGIDEKELDYK